MKETSSSLYHRFVAVTFALIGLSAWSLSAVATETLSEDFEGFSAGTMVDDQVEGISFSLPLAVFVPPEARTATPPNAARNVLDCNNDACTNGAYRVEMDFPRLARRVSLRAGDVLEGCFEFDCPYAQLIGFNDAGEIVAASPAKRIPSGTFEQPAGFGAEITEPFEIDAGDFSIARAVLYVGKDDVFGRDLGEPRPAQIDSLEYTILEEGEAPPPPGAGPGMPQVEITDPLDDDVFLHTDLLAAGDVTAPAGVAAFCIVANEISFPTPCDAAAAVHTNSDGDLVFGPTRVQGTLDPNDTNVLTAFLRDGRGRVATDTVHIEISPTTLDLTVEAMEITQVVQIKDIHTQADTFLISGSSTVPGLVAPYEGVPLAEQKRTIARVFVSGAFEATGDLGPSRVRDVPVLLHAFNSGYGELPGSPIRPDAAAPAVQGTFDLPALRADPEGAFTFTLPVSWTERSEIILAAEVAPAAATEAYTDAAPNDNGLFVEGIPFTPQRELDVWPVSLRSTESGVTSQPDQPLSQFFQNVTTVTPAPIRLHPPLAEVDITDPVVRLRNPDGTFDDDFQVIDAAIDLIAEATEDRTLDGKIVGLITTPGVVSGKGPGPIAATGSINRGLDFVGHELYHTYGYKHARTDPVSDKACGVGGENWSPDQRGLLHGIGLDPRIGSGGEPRLYKPIGKEDPAVFDATPDAPSEVHDLMSYCSKEPDKTWLSTDYWTVGVRGFAPEGDIRIGDAGGCCRLSAPDDVTAAREALRVTAIIEPDGIARILRVSSVAARPDDADLDSGVQLRLRNNVGDIVASTDVEPIQFAGRPGPGQTDQGPSLYVAATLAAPDAQTAELVVEGAVEASRDRSPSAPTVEIEETPTGHCVLFGDGTFGRVPSDERLRLEYRASDADGDDLRGKVEFSPDGQDWRTLATGIVGSPVTLSGDLLSRSDAAHLRVTVNDGFNSTSDTCGPFPTEGRGVTVNIASPETGTEVNADAMLRLDGFAFDDNGESISGTGLEWHSGSQVLGEGAVLSVPAWQVDESEGITLIAEADDGLTGEATVDISIREVRPLFLTLEPRPLRGEAKVIALRVSSSMPETLHISGSGVVPGSHEVSPEERNITIRLNERLDAHDLVLQLGSGELRTTKEVTVERIRVPGRGRR